VQKVKPMFWRTLPRRLTDFRLTDFNIERQGLGLSNKTSLIFKYLLPTLAVFLFWFLWVKSQAVDYNQHSWYISELRRLQELDARINQNILQSRLGLLMYYDPITNELTALRQIQANLEQPPAFVSASGNLELQKELQSHRQSWQKKEKLFQQFQAENSILRNSLAYFPTAIAEGVEQAENSTALATPLNQLLQNVLLFNLSPNNLELAPKINRDIEAIRAKIAANQPNASLANTLSHARVILKSRPRVDALVRDLMAQPTLTHGEALFKTYERAYLQAIDEANLYRHWFYLLSTVGVIGIAASIILKLRAAATAIRQSEQKYRTIFENSQVGIGRTSLDDGLFLEVNQRFAEIMGFQSPAQLNGTRSATDFYLHPEGRSRILAELEQQGQVHNFEEQLRRADGSIVWLLLWLHPNPEANCLDFVITDISHRKQIEAELQRAAEAAKVASQAKSQFLSHMSHELRSPLNVILGFTQLIIRNTELSTQQQTYLDAINRSGEHLLTLINDVLEMSKIEAGKITLNEHDFDLYALLNVLQTMFEHKAESKGLRFSLEQDLEVPQFIYGDESKLRQVLINLLGNAMKFTQTGRVSLRTGLRPVETEQTQDSRSPVQLVFEVEDTGPGIPAAEVEHLFEPFIQTEVGRQSQEGTGLGLSICRKFVQIMGGEISVESQVNRGSCFRFTILARRATSLLVPTQTGKVIGLETGGPTFRILAVEDKLENRQVLVELLESVGFEVKEAANGQEAIALNQSWSPHLIWMDLRMPVLDGYQATQRIKAAKAAGEPVPTIIALTGSAFEEERAHALAIGCDDFLRKPYRVEDIFTKMTEYLGVRYRYAEPQEQINPGLSQPKQSLALSRKDLAGMSPEWIAQVHQAATRVNAKLLLVAIAEIPDAEVYVANALTQLVNQCCFEEIVALTHPSGEQRN
jgi:PAS domain S-box-containing protein